MQWQVVKVAMGSFSLDFSTEGSGSGSGSGSTPFRADRLTMGLCLQRLDGCSAATPNLDLCLDKLVIVNTA